MKLVFCLATLLIASSLCEASSRRNNEARRLDREVSSYVFQLRRQAFSDARKYAGAIQSRVVRYLSEYSKLRESIGRELFGLGSRGQEIARKIDTDVKGLTDSVRAASSPKTIQAKAKEVLGDVKALYIAPLRADYNALKKAVEANPEAISCWDDNKVALKAIADSATSTVRAAINSNLNQLDVKAAGVVTKIRAAVIRIETQLRTTCTNTDCVVDYVRKFQFNVFTY